ncbi:hypothetical protein KY362_06540 [Candidatus Woesearchaeota archaeon]|nr:hypothetical protein [Candidatus Woesearchaeota archaeon]
MAPYTPKVIIREEALVMIASSAVEVYNKETYGLLLGRRHKRDYVLQYAVPYQAALRYVYGVNVVAKREKALINSMNFFKGCKYMGEYHSHPESYCILTKDDIKGMKAEAVGISLVIAIDKTDIRRPWKYDKRQKNITGTIDDDYIVEIKAYWFNEKRNRVIKLRLECDYIKKLNKRMKKYHPELFSRKQTQSKTKRKAVKKTNKKAVKKKAKRRPAKKKAAKKRAVKKKAPKKNKKKQSRRNA